MSTMMNSDREHAEAVWVLGSLQRWDDRFRGRQTEKRRQSRTVLQSVIQIHLTKAEDAKIRSSSPDAVTVWSRNVSPAGISFITRRQIDADDVVVTLDIRDRQPLHFQAKIIRRRKVHEGFIEYGAVFLERLGG